MRNLNRVDLIGNVVADPEMSYTPSGAAICKFRIATNRTWNKGGEIREEATFHRIIAWEKLGELINKFLVKGSLVYIEGRIQVRQYEDKDKNKREMFEIVANDFLVLKDRKIQSEEQVEGKSEVLKK